MLSPALETESAIGYYLSFMMEPMGAGYAFVIFLDRRRRVVTTVKVKDAGFMVSSTVAEAIDRALRNKRIEYFILAHNHFGNPTTPSFADLHTTRLLYRKYSGTGTKFLGHYIISDFDYTVITDGGQANHTYSSKLGGSDYK